MTYLAIVMDVFSRRIVGWSMGERMNAQLVLTVLNIALAQCKPQGVTHHLDQGNPTHGRMYHVSP